MRISSKLKLNTLLVLIGLIILATLSYFSIKDLKQINQQQKDITNQLSHYKSILIGGLLVNSASGVYAFNPKSLKPIKAAEGGLAKVKEFTKKIDKKDPKIIENFVKTAEATLNFARKNNYLSPKEMSTLLKVWRPLKFDIMKKTKSVKKEAKKLTEQYNNTLESLSITIFTTIILITIIVAVLNYLISKGIITSLSKLEKSMKDLSQGHSSGKIEIENNDETAIVANYFNIYMDNIEKGLQQDKLVINEVKSVITKINAGLFNVSIKQKPNSHEVEELVIALNEMIVNTHTNLNDLSRILRDLANSKFDTQIRHIPGMTGTIASMFSGLRATKNTVQELLALIDNSNKKLLFSSNDLSKSAEKLNKSSNEQAAFLEETAAAVEEVTDTIIQSSKNTLEMSQYAQKVTRSLATGEKLAGDTAQSMDEINAQVTAINEAITVIDQIAFQTNILSLNAAVEAATAGEAGKGFAVVAGEVRNLASRSADAANEIKALVENAASKADIGKTIATQMIEGYSELNQNITHTTELIDQVANATKEQEATMQQINNAITSLDQTTQTNASEASGISTMAKDNEQLAQVLQSAVDGTSFDKSCKERVCDVGLIFETTKLKLSHIDLKDDAIKRAGQGESFSVKSHKECGLGCWITKQENAPFANSKEFEELKTAHETMHKKTQQLVDLHMQPNSDTQIIAVANEVEENIDIVFDKLNQIRKVNCDIEFAKRKQQNS